MDATATSTGMAGIATLGSFAFIGVLVGFWGQIKSFLSRFISIFFIQVALDVITGTAVSAYCWQTKKKWSFGNRSYGNFLEYVRPKKRMQNIVFENIDHRPEIGRASCRERV